MKLQINGFDIEINTDEANITMKVMDANGKELSNNTYSQSSEQAEDVVDVEMPETEDAIETTEETTEEPLIDVEGSTEEESTEEEDESTETEEEQSDVEETGESLIVDFETFKKQLREQKENK